MLFNNEVGLPSDCNGFLHCYLFLALRFCSRGKMFLRKWLASEIPLTPGNICTFLSMVHLFSRLVGVFNISVKCKKSIRCFSCICACNCAFWGQLLVCCTWWRSTVWALIAFHGVGYIRITINTCNLVPYPSPFLIAEFSLIKESLLFCTSFADILL